MARVRKRSKTQGVKKPTMEELRAAGKNIAKLLAGFEAMAKDIDKHFPEHPDALDLACKVLEAVCSEYGGAPDNLVIDWWCDEMHRWDELSFVNKAYIRLVIDIWVDWEQVEDEFYPVCCYFWGMVSPEEQDVLDVEEWALNWLGANGLLPEGYYEDQQNEMGIS